MNIQQATFICSQTDYNKCPAPDKPEYAFIGRSNVGKSSLVNTLTNRKQLAHISSKPGKTRTINHFLIDNEWYLVDLPGYGYAKISKKEREQFSALTQNYLQYRPNLLCTFVLVDSKVPPQRLDLDFMRMLGEKQLPFVIVFTKTDRLKEEELTASVENFREAFLQEWEFMPDYFLTSAEENTGTLPLLQYIASINNDRPGTN